MVIPDRLFCPDGVRPVPVPVLAPCAPCPLSDQPTPFSHSNSYVKSQTEIGTPDLKPPDLWIHHDQTELRPIGKQRSDSCSTLRRPSPDYDLDDRPYAASTLDRKERMMRAQSPGVGKGTDGGGGEGAGGGSCRWRSAWNGGAYKLDVVYSHVCVLVVISFGMSFSFIPVRRRG